MNGRRQHRKRGFRRVVVTLLAFVMMLSVCFPGLIARAEDGTEGAQPTPSQPLETTPTVHDQLFVRLVALQDGVKALNRDKFETDEAHAQAYAGAYETLKAKIDFLDADIAKAYKDQTISTEEYEALTKHNTLLTDLAAEAPVKAAGEGEEAVTGESASESTEASGSTSTSESETATPASSETTTPASSETTEPVATETTVPATSENTEPVCTCTPVNGVHAEFCDLYVEPGIDTAAVDALFVKLMSFDFYEALDAYMSDEMTDDDYVLMGYFTEEQNAALNAHISSINDNDNVILADLTIEQGSSKTTTVSGASQYDYRIRKDNTTVTDSGITLSISGDSVTVQVSETTEPGEYTIQFGEWRSFIVSWFDEATSVTVTVTEASTGGSGTTTGPAVETKKMTYDKTATSNGDGTYNLELTLSGSVGSQTNKALVDVVFIVDNSNSMYPDQSTYMSRLKPAMQALVDNISTTNGDKIDAQYSLAMFGTNSEIRSNFTSASNIKTAINNISNYSYNAGGTNYQAGIYQGKQLLNSKRAGATTVVIFVTDGLPTYRGAPNMTNGTGNSDSAGYNIDAAESEIGGMSCNYFYCIGIGSNFTNTSKTEYQNMSKLTAAVNATNTGIYGVQNGTVTELENVFNSITAQVTTFLCENVTITDTLNHVDSELMVEVTNPDTVMVTVYKGDNVIVGPAKSVNLAKTGNNEAATLTASYDESTHVLTLDFPDDYQLEPDYTYKLSAVIKPTEKAYQEYRENSGYTDRADANTGTHSGELGFYANDGATVTYTYNGVDGTATYAKPVIQLDPGTLVLTKEFEGLTADDVPDLTFPVTLTFPGTAAQSTDIPFSYFKDDDGDGIYTFEMTGMSPGTQYSITETGYELDGYNIETTITGADTVNGIVGSGTIAKGGTETVAFKNVYSLANTYVTVHKTVSGNMGDINKKFSFEMSLKDDAGNVLAFPAAVTGDDYTVENNVAKFSLGNGDTITIDDIPIGAKLTVKETNALDADYDVFISVDSLVTDATSEDTDASYEITVGEHGHTIYFKNDKDVIVDTGIATDSMPFIILFATAMGVFATVVFGKRRYTGRF